MTAHYPVLPLAGSAVLRGVTGLLAFVTYWSRQIARARRHRRDAAVLAGLDRSMLADLGLTRSDVRDAFSEPTEATSGRFRMVRTGPTLHFQVVPQLR